MGNYGANTLYYIDDRQVSREEAEEQDRLNKEVIRTMPFERWSENIKLVIVIAD